MRPSSYNIIVSLPDSDRKLVFQGYTGAVDLVQPHVAELLRPGAQRPPFGPASRVSTTTIRALAERGYFTEKSREQETAYAAELGRRVHRVMRRHASPGVLVVPSYSCNLRCDYCYEKHLQGKGTAWLSRRMTPEQAEALFQATATLGDKTHPARSLTFYGGEPFQPGNAPIVRFLFARARQRGFRSFSAVTNGVELDRFKDLLGPDGKIAFLQITLDGPGEVHDGRRPLPGGQGTFTRITANISLALALGVRVSVRMNIDRRNADRVHEAHAFFREQGWDRSKLFQAYCSPVHSAEPCASRNASCFTSHLEMQQVVERNLARSSPDLPGEYLHVASLTHSVQRRILAHLQQRHGLPRWRTAFCGSNMSMFVFDPFGDIYPCWEVIGRREHRIGTYGPGSLDLDERAVETWHNRSVVEIKPCRSCAYLFFCGGGCEAFAIARNGRPDSPHCFDFPRHFQVAAVLAFREWQTRPAEAGTQAEPLLGGSPKEAPHRRPAVSPRAKDPSRGAGRRPADSGKVSMGHDAHGEQETKTTGASRATQRTAGATP